MTARLPKFLATVMAPCALYAVACGGGGGSKVDSGIHLIDGSGSGSGSGVCNAAASYGTITPTMEAAQTAGSGTTGSNAHNEVWVGNLNTDVDGLQLELYAGFGGFNGVDIKTGTFSLTGSDAQYSSCGICLRLFTNITGSGSQAMSADQYFATGGSVTLTSISGSNFAGSLSNVTLQHVTIDPTTFTSTVVGDCTSTISSGNLAAALQVGSAAFTGTIVEPYGETLRHRYR